MGNLAAPLSDLAKPERERGGEGEGQCERERGKGKVNVVARDLAIQWLF